jgi:hypothetical protein
MPATKTEPYVASGRPDLSSAETRAGWNEPIPHTPPQPTFWPAVMALAAAGMMAGIVLDDIVIGVSLALFAIAGWGWTGDLLREQSKRNQP